MQDRFCLWKVLTSLLALGCLVQLLSIDHEPSQGALYLLLVIVGLPHQEKSKSSCKISNYMTLSQSFFMKAVTSWEHRPCIFLWNKPTKATRTKWVNLNSIFVPAFFLNFFTSKHSQWLWWERPDSICKLLKKKIKKICSYLFV